MGSIVFFLWMAGAIQLLDVVVNLALPRTIQCRENLARVSPLVRQVFIVHWFYILLVLVIFGAACLLFAPDLAGGSPLLDRRRRRSLAPASAAGRPELTGSIHVCEPTCRARPITGSAKQSSRFAPAMTACVIKDH